MTCTPSTDSRHPGPARFGQLDAMRFVFALVVVVVHTVGFRLTLIHGAFAVDFFFVLSGFVLTHALRRRPMGALEFAGARLARLYPLHLAALVWLVCLVGLPSHAPGSDYPSFVLNLLLLQGLGFGGADAWNFPSWSISVEFLINILVLYPVVRGRALAGAAILVAAAITALVCAVGPVFDRSTVQPLYGTFLSGGFLRGMIGILAGYLLYNAHLHLTPRLEPARYVGIATVCEVLAIAGLGYSLWVDHPLWNLLPLPLSALLILQMATVPGRLSALLQTRPFPDLGDLSYSIYLLHIPLFATFVAAGLLPLSDSGLSPVWFVYFALLLGLAAVSHRRLERPAQRSLMRAFGRWRTSPSKTIVNDDGAPS